MNTKHYQIQGLKKSIEHWKENESITHYTQIKMDIDDCALCELYFEDNCKACPIREVSGSRNCHNTPYDEIMDIDRLYHSFAGLYPDIDVSCYRFPFLMDWQITQEMKLAAKKERLYLEALLFIYENDLEPFFIDR